MTIQTMNNHYSMNNNIFYQISVVNYTLSTSVAVVIDFIESILYQPVILLASKKKKRNMKKKKKEKIFVPIQTCDRI